MKSGISIFQSVLIIYHQNHLWIVGLYVLPCFSSSLQHFQPVCIAGFGDLFLKRGTLIQAHSCGSGLWINVGYG